MRLAIIALLLGPTLLGCKSGEPVTMDQGRIVPSSTGKCQDYVAGRTVNVACPK